jgi:hypothetical protein
VNFDDWFCSYMAGTADELSTQAAWNAAIAECIRVVEARGKKIKGAIQPDRTIAELRKLQEFPGVDIDKIHKR